MRRGPPALRCATSTLPSLRIKTWNCFGTGQDVLSYLRWRGVPDGHRLAHPAVLEAVRGADVLCLQEVFLGEAEGLFDALDHAHKLRDENRAIYWPPTLCGSGLAIASRVPIVERTFRAFRPCAVGADRFARKGMLHARLRLPAAEPVEIDLVTTHLQAGCRAGARIARARQLAEIRELVDRVGSHERAFLICGDLNIDGLSSCRDGEYESLVATFPDFVDLGADSDHVTFHPQAEFNALAHRYSAGSPPQRIDYVLFRRARDGRVLPGPCELAFERPLTGHGAPTHPSDHFALRLDLRIDS